MTTYYAVMSVLALINLIVFLFLFTKKNLNYYILGILALIAISNAGNLALSMSETLGEAFIAKKITYLGGCFMPPIHLIIIFELCNIDMHKWVKNLLLLFSVLIYGMSLSIGYSDIYYQDASLIKIGNATAISPVYGFGHIFFYILLYGHLLIGIFVLFYTLKNKISVSRKNLRALIGMEVTTILLFFFGRMLVRNLEITPFTYIIDGWIFLYLTRRIALYSLEDNIISSLEKQNTYGYIMFDNKRNYLGANALALEIFPELRLCRIDQPLPHLNSLAFVQKELDEYNECNDSGCELDRDGAHYEGHINRFWYGNKAAGYFFELENVTDKYRYTRLLATYNDNLKLEVEEKTAHINNMQSKILLGMANIVENRDGNTGGHIKRTSQVVEILIDTIKEQHLLPLEESFCQAVIKAAPMHDLGKIRIDDKILRKPGRLTAEEFAIMQTHAAKSGELVESILEGVEDSYFVNIAKNIARHHHEKWNGSGYPDHLSEDAIPLEARIMAIADVYDALVSKRCYKEAMSFEQAYQVMMESMGNHFDPQMKDIFIKSRTKLEAYYLER